MFFTFLYLIFVTSLFGSNLSEIHVSKKYNIISYFPLEVRLEIADFLYKPSEKCLLFLQYERGDDKFYYGRVLKRNLDDVVWRTAIGNIRSEQYKVSSEENKIFRLTDCERLEGKLNALYNIFITDPRNILKYCYGSWFDSNIENKLSDMERTLRELWEEELKELSPKKRDEKLEKIVF